MIVRDESDCLGACLKAARPLFDELCIVDTGSKDQTKAIAYHFGAKVLDFEWKDDFASARNYGLAHATKDWVVVLDADEIVSEELIAQIKTASIDETIGALSMLLNDAQANGHRRTTRLLRAWRRCDKVRYQHRIHEDITPSLTASLHKRLLKVVHLDGSIEHTGYDREVAGKKNKKSRDERILKAAIKENPNDLYSWFKLCELARFWEDNPLLTHAATCSLRLLATMKTDRRHHFVGELLEHIAFDASRRGIPVQQRLMLVERFVPHWRDDATLAHLWGSLLEATGDRQQAATAYALALTAPIGKQDRQRATTRPRLGLARLALEDQDNELALKHIELALVESPSDPEALYAYATLSQLAGRAVICLKKYEEQFGYQEQAIVCFVESALALGRTDQAQEILRERPDAHRLPSITHVLSRTRAHP